MKIENPIAPLPAALAPLHEAILECLRGHAVQLDLRVLGAQAPVRSSSLSGHPVLVVRVTPGSVHLAWFGADAGQGCPCPECLDRRALALRSSGEQWAAHQEQWAQGQGAPLLLEPVCRSIALLCAARCAQPPQPGTPQEVWTFDLHSQEVRIDGLLADTFCSNCGPASHPDERSARLRLRPRLRARSGLGRMRELLDYQLPHSALINPVCGAAAPYSISGYVQSITAPVFAQYLQRAFDAAPRQVGWSGLCLRTDESRTAGLLEALERQAGMLAHPGATAVVDSYDNLGARAMDPALCFAYNEASYEANLGLTRYDPALPIEWVWGYSVTERRSVLVPRQLAYYDRIRTESRAKLADNNSSGCALGSCYEEAILKGLFELIERDSFVIAWQRKLSLPRIDPASCADRKTRLVLNRIDYLGYDITLLDGRLDLRVPAVIAMAHRRDGALGAMTVGGAASLDPREAVRSALLECATSIVEMPAMFAAQEQRIRALPNDFSKVVSVMDHSLLYAMPDMARQLDWLRASPVQRSFDDCYEGERDWHAQGDIGADLEKVLRELRRRGMDQVVVVDLTTPEQRQLELVTVRVLVPGMAPIDFGHPRNRAAHLPRLQSAPVVAGLEPGLGLGGNPLPHPFP